MTVPDRWAGNGLLAAGALAEPGSTLRLPPAGFISRYAYVICAGRDPGECAALLETAMSEVRLTAHPLSAAALAASGGNGPIVPVNR